MHTTNYYNTLIEVSEDTKATSAEIPPQKGEKKSIANMQFEILANEPYHHTSDDLIFEIYALRKGFPKKEWKQLRKDFYSKGQACLRTSPLAKIYGWGIHHNQEGKLAIYPMESHEYQKLLKDKSVYKVKAMRSSGR